MPLQKSIKNQVVLEFLLDSVFISATTVRLTVCATRVRRDPRPPGEL